MHSFGRHCRRSCCSRRWRVRAWLTRRSAPRGVGVHSDTDRRPSVCATRRCSRRSSASRNRLPRRPTISASSSTDTGASSSDTPRAASRTTRSGRPRPLSAEAFERFGQERDKYRAVQLFQWLRDQYPHSPLQAKAAPQIEQLEAMAASPAAAATTPAVGRHA